MLREAYIPEARGRLDSMLARLNSMLARLNSMLARLNVERFVGPWSVRS